MCLHLQSSGAAMPLLEYSLPVPQCAAYLSAGCRQNSNANLLGQACRVLGIVLAAMH